MKKIKIWYSILNCGDGSAYPTWFLTQKDADFHNDSQLDGWAETCAGSVETFTGADIHKKAVENSNNLCKKCGEVKYGNSDWCRC